MMSSITRKKIGGTAKIQNKFNINMFTFTVEQVSNFFEALETNYHCYISKYFHSTNSSNFPNRIAYPWVCEKTTQVLNPTLKNLPCSSMFQIVF